MSDLTSIGGIASIGDPTSVVAYAALAVLLAAACATDLRSRLIPDWIPLGIAAAWLVCGIAGALLGAGAIGSSATGAAEPAALGAAGPVALADALAARLLPGLVAALAFGGGLLLFTLAFEALAHHSGLGGGDLKLMAACALHLGLEGGAVCLLVACALSIPLAVVVPRTRFACEGERAGALPFAPALAVGTLAGLLT